MTVLVHGPGAYPKPPYGSFAGKAATSADSKNFVQVFTVHGPGGYSKSPYGNFAGRNAQASIPKVGFIGGGKPAKRWWEELLEEYKEKYPERLTRKAARKVEKVLEPAIEAAEMLGETLEVQSFVRAVQVPSDTVQIITAANAVIRAAELAVEDDEEDLLMLLLS